MSITNQRKTRPHIFVIFLCPVLFILLGCSSYNVGGSDSMNADEDAIVEMNQPVQVILDEAPARAEPGVQHELVGRLASGEIVTAIARTADGDWYRVALVDTSTGVQVAWISAEFLSTTIEVTPPVVDDVTATPEATETQSVALIPTDTNSASSPSLPPDTPTPTDTPTETQTSTPLPPNTPTPTSTNTPLPPSTPTPSVTAVYIAPIEIPAESLFLRPACGNTYTIPASAPIDLSYGAWGARGQTLAAENAQATTIVLRVDGVIVSGIRQPIVPMDGNIPICGSYYPDSYWIYHTTSLDPLPAGTYNVEVVYLLDHPLDDGYGSVVSSNFTQRFTIVAE